MQAFLQSLYLEWQETGPQAATSSGFLSSCLTSLQSPLADVPLTTGLEWQIAVASAVSIHVQANRHLWVRSLGLWLDRERTVQSLCIWLAKVWIPHAAHVLRTACLQFSDFFSLPSFLPVLKCWKHSAYEDALLVKDCKSVMCEEIFSDTMMSTFQWVEKSLQ